ncbi:MAG: hypothetical protein IJE43_02390 [Alphaproteobacteria bacterium]|nr:hypothetical protein [Alphaproteobacteria bacterium]
MKVKGGVKVVVIGFLAGICAYVLNEQWKIKKHGDKALQRSAEWHTSEDIFDTEIAKEFDEVQL